MHLNLDGNGPIYAQLTRALRHAISSGHLRNGERLPPTRALARTLRVSRTTIVGAYAQLSDEGLIRARVGSGSYVHAPVGAPVSVKRRREVAAQTSFSRRARSLWSAETRDDLAHAYRYDLRVRSEEMGATPLARRPVAIRGLAHVRVGNHDLQGLRTLREAICRYLALHRAVHCSPDDILIVNSTRHALDLTARVLLEPGAAVAIEDPCCFRLRHLLLLHGARIATMAVDEQGASLAQVEAMHAQLICVTPSCQFPTGAVLTAPRRAALVAMAERDSSWIFEMEGDHADRPRDAAPAVYSMDGHDRTLYVGGFPRTLCPGLHVGYMVVPGALKEDFLAAKWAADLNPAPHAQLALAEMLRNGTFVRQLHLHARTLAERRAHLAALLGRVLAGRCRLAHTDAGGSCLVVWLDGTSALQIDRLVDVAATRGLGLTAARHFFADGSGRAGLVLATGSLALDRMDAAVSLLRDCLEDATPGP
ncbi:PLP-dependent aminotransferase family protein [Lysobacter soli]|uniref:aminotransferase-like domain-containing protein n=1 Tax=Lysobacter soli TaxID=453783 RepID=UPI00240FFBE0|nr:PLP-dependent aminotransferase family protein [Lysobacter soli]MDG2517154.1 PLP-dependent aminotransferase family protein [Lysobacter soli]